MTTYDGPALAGFYDVRSPLGADEARAAVGAALGSDAEVMTLGPLTVAWRQGEDGRAGEVSAALIGRPWNVPPVNGGSVAGELAARWQRLGAMQLLEQARGSFAVAFWDESRARGVISGDAAGAYAVYYAANGSRITFATEVAILARLLPRRPEPDPLAIVNALGGGGIPGVTTMFRGVQRVPEGSLLQLVDGRAVEARYWAPPYGPDAPTSHAAVVSALWSHVEEAVDVRLEHGGHSAIMMSGGVDSSTVAAAASRRVRRGDALTGYAAVFPDHPDVDESDRINELSRALKLRVVQAHVKPAGIMRLALEFLSRWETGFPGPGYVLEQELLRRAVADGATIALDGQGGDEAFSPQSFLPTDLLLRGRVVASWQAIRRFPGAHGRSWRRIGRAWKEVALAGAVPHGVELARRRRADPASHTPAWLRPELARRYMAESDGAAWKLVPGPRAWAFNAHMLAGSARLGFAEYLRRRAQPLGIEARPPLIDMDLIEFVLRLPPEAAFDPFLDRPLIREAMLHLVPDSVRLARRKSNVSPFYHDGVMADFEAVRRLLGAPDAHIFEFVEREPVMAMLNAPAGRDDSAWLQRLTDLWSLSGFEAWLRQQADPASVAEMLDGWGLSEPSSETVRVSGRRR